MRKRIASVFHPRRSSSNHAHTNSTSPEHNLAGLDHNSSRHQAPGPTLGQTQTRLTEPSSLPSQTNNMSDSVDMEVDHESIPSVISPATQIPDKTSFFSPEGLHTNQSSQPEPFRAPTGQFPAKPENQNPSQTQVQSQFQSQNTAQRGAGGAPVEDYTQVPRGASGATAQAGGANQQLMSTNQLGHGQSGQPDQSEQHGQNSAQDASQFNRRSAVSKGKYSLTDFVIQRTLGTGSFGRVHLVRSVHNGRFYAIKVLKKARIVKMKQVEHTNDERRMLKIVDHPFLTRMWGTFQDARNLFMVMDYIEGGELFSLLRRSQRFPNQVAKFYAAEVVLALEYLHAQDIIYRDLKPENILLDRNGHIKITDFGFAKEVKDVTWTLCGTPDYIAPEVVSTKAYNKSVDWWSLGILIYEMLTGYTPFYDQTPMKTYENILVCNVRYPSYLNQDAVDLLQKLITKDLSKRLGNLGGGPSDVKNHPWFAEVLWAKLLSKDIETPYEPPIQPGTGDTSLFDRYPEEQQDYGVTGEDPYADLFTDF